MGNNFKIYNLQSVIRNSPSPYSSPLRGEGWGEGAGFTLIEIAVVLVILGLLVTLGASMIGPLTKRAKVIESREAVKATKEALLGYVVKYGYLPTTIGPSGARELDAWGRSLVYYVPTSLGGACTGTCTGSVCSTGVGSCGICNLTSTDRTIFECTNTACTTANQKNNIAFIIYSTSEDAEGTGTTTQPTGGPACSSGTCYWIREQMSDYTVGAITYQYDDLVQYVTLDEIRSARSCSFTITTNSLPDANTGVAYSVTLQASGGQTPYTSWTITAGALPVGITLGAATGIISGTTTTSGVYNFTVTLTDANAVTTTKAFTLLVNISVDPTIPNPPTFGVGQGANRATLSNINVTWTTPTTNVDTSPITDLAGYEIYRSLTGIAGSYALLQLIGAGTSFTDTFLTAGQRYFYRMQAVDKYGNKSANSTASSTTVSPIRQTVAAAWSQPNNQAACTTANLVPNCGTFANRRKALFTIQNTGNAADNGANITVTSMVITWGTTGGTVKKIQAPNVTTNRYCSTAGTATGSTTTLTTPLVINAGSSTTMGIYFCTTGVQPTSVSVQFNTADGSFSLY